jgi:hypothetical protein
VVKTFHYPRLIPHHLTGSEVPNWESSANVKSQWTRVKETTGPEKEMGIQAPQNGTAMRMLRLAARLTAFRGIHAVPARWLSGRDASRPSVQPGAFRAYLYVGGVRHV